MGHVIDHDNLQTRTWVCTKCGCKCLSKNPWQRNTHGESPGGVLGTMYLGHLQSVSLAKRVPACPARPKEDAQVYWQEQYSEYPTVLIERDTAFCRVGQEHDIALYYTPDYDIRDTGKPLKTDAEQLLAFLKSIRESPWEVLQAYACAQFGGHRWTDDPAELAKWKKDEDADA